VLIIACSIGYFASVGLVSPGPQFESQFRNLRVEPIVADADIRNAVISPSGKYLLLLQVKSGVQSLYLRQVENGNTTELVSGINGTFVGATFSPVSEQIYYTLTERTENKRPTSTLYKLSPMGGASQKILHDIDSPVAVSADEQRLAFIRQQDGQRTSLVVADIDGIGEQQLAVREADAAFSPSGVSWSPNGRLLAASVNDRVNNRGSVAVVNAQSGEQEIVSSASWVSTGQTIWLQDGSGIIVTAFGTKSPSLNDELWLVSYPGGTSRLVAESINASYGISLNASTGSVIAVESNKFACFLVAPVENLFRNTHLLTTISDESPLPFGADWTADGLIVYSAVDSGNADIFTINESGERKQLTSDPSAEISPQISADGRFLTFLSNRTGQMEVWRADANGINASPITAAGNVRESVISADSKTVYYVATEPQREIETLWRVDMTGENNRQLTNTPTRSPRTSPDGQSIACYILDPKTNLMMLALISPQNGEVLRSIALPEHSDIPFIDWSKDGEALYVVLQRGKAQSLWKVALKGTRPEQLREWENDAIFRLAISRSGDKVFYEVGNRLNSVVEIQSLDAVSRSNVAAAPR
jgi:Tol biopolymer transport system component